MLETKDVETIENITNTNTIKLTNTNKQNQYKQ